MSQTHNNITAAQMLLEFTKKELGKNKLTSVEKKKIIDMYNSINPEIFRGAPMREAMRASSIYIAKRINQQQKHTSASNTSVTHVPEIDMHEKLKSIIGTPLDDKYVSSYLDADEKKDEQPQTNYAVNSFLGVNELSTMQLLFNPESLYVYYYTVLDTDYRLTAEEGATTTKFKWNYSPTPYTATGFCNSVGKIRDVIGMRLYQPRVHYVSSGMNTTSKRVSILVEEFAPQAFIAETGRRFHFLLRPDLEDPGNTIELSTEDYNDGIFRFRRPITSFDTLTISFGDPLNLISFPTDGTLYRMVFAFEFVCYKSDK